MYPEIGEAAVQVYCITLMMLDPWKQATINEHVLNTSNITGLSLKCKSITSYALIQIY